MADRHDVLRQLGVEARHRAVQVRHLVGDHHRDRERGRAVDPDHVTARELAGGDHLVEARLRILHDLIVLGRSPEPHLEHAIGQADVVRGHGTLLSFSSGPKPLNEFSRPSQELNREEKN